MQKNNYEELKDTVKELLLFVRQKYGLVSNDELTCDIHRRLAKLISDDSKPYKNEISEILSKANHCCELGQDWYELEAVDFERIQKLFNLNELNIGKSGKI